MKNILLGASGQLGTELQKILPEYAAYGHESGNIEGIDITNIKDMEEAFRINEPGICINAAALANVDRCEKEPELAMKVNALSVKNIAEQCRKFGTRFVHVSTDYVFDGRMGNYKEDSIPNPINYYGLSKLLGDVYANSYENSLIVRTSGVFGQRNNFPMFVYNQLKDGNPVKAMKGYYSPIHAKNLALGIKKSIGIGIKGIINIASERVSRYDLAVSIAKMFDFSTENIEEIESLPSMIAKRPFDSSLSIKNARNIIDFDFYTIKSNLRVFKETLGE